jgi:hypothetical protein
MHGGMIVQHSDETKSYVSGAEPNWSSIDVDAPYTWCRVCTGVCTCDMEDGGTTNSGPKRDGESDEYQSCGSNNPMSMTSTL